ncbi:MAG: SRPBCC domain-containing protein [Actinomycetes bacterium]
MSTTTTTTSDDDDALGEVVFERVFDAPYALVFEAMTTPEHLCEFFGPPGMSTPLENITIELRVGGVFETVMVNDATGEEYPNLGVYTELDPPNFLAFRESGEVDGMTTSIEFIDIGGGRTKTVTRQSKVPAAYRSPEAMAGMEASFVCFDEYLATIT